jgi:hypothetical protein
MVDMEEEAPKTVYRPWWAPIGEFFALIDTAKLAIIGIVWYGFLSITYDQFYRPLGINPSDIGLNYAALIAASVGTALVVLLPIFLTVMALIALALLLRSRLLRMGLGRFIYYGDYWPRLVQRLAVVFFSGLAIMATAVIIYQFPLRAGEEAKEVQQGHRVSPVRMFLSPVPALSIRADPVVAIQGTAVRKTGESSPVESLTPTGLFFMGQSNGVIVLYDSNSRRAIYLPASSVLVSVQSR